MRSSLPYLAMLAVALVSSASVETESLDIEMIQEGTAMGSLIKHQAKHAIMSKQELDERNLVMLGDVATDRAKVAVAQQQLKKVLGHIGQRHPEYLLETQEMQDFVSNDLLGESNSGKKLEGGYTKLKKILFKIDDLELELDKELREEEEKRQNNRDQCTHDIDQLEDDIATLQSHLDDAHSTVHSKKGDNVEAQERIRQSRDSEAGSDRSFEAGTQEELEERRKKYDEYWALTDDSAAVRNILMQALWMVCTGFRSFRHVPYCETLRKQPDYAEPPLPQGAANDQDQTYLDHKKASEKFSHTMEATWIKQKKADSHAANSEDGDVDMEKAFPNNKAPWGVDPAKDGEESQDMTHEQMATRLSFLLQEGTVSPKVSTPINGMIEALQTGTFDDAAIEAAAKAGQETLVDALAGLDQQEGVAQHDRDEAYATFTDMTREQLDGNAKGIITETQLQGNKQQLIFQNEKDIRAINAGVKGHEAEQATKAATIKDRMNECEKIEIESDAIIEVAKEELVNVQRLNSLLRFLALGDDPSDLCSGTQGGCVEGQGTCTWWTRGSNAQGHDLHGESNKDKTFCACEYGFYGEQCEMRKCKGFGRIRYKADQPGVCSNKENCEACNHCSTTTGLCTCHARHYHGKWSKCEKSYCPTSVDSVGKTVYAKNEAEMANECVSSAQGECNAKRGRCECKADFWGPHCGYHKCKSADDQGSIMAAKYRGTSPNACSGRGACDADTGQCGCEGDRYFGDACQFSSCDCSGKGQCNTLTGLCLCDAGAVGGSCIQGEGCHDCDFKPCDSDCSGSNGMCDRNTGACVCATVKTTQENNQYQGPYNGKVCLEPRRKNKYLADWTRSMDTWGWSVCKTNWLLTGLKRDGLGDALYNLGYGVCEQPAEGAGDPIGIAANECYHENWWKKFDSKGGKFCRRGYFVAGLFRSHCNSLYCIEMAKCCRVKRSAWNRCKWESYREDEDTKEATVEAPAFIVGFYRDATHTLDGITWFRSCVPYFYGADYR
eukprot:TRINITY_DN1235_c0_g1_i4.p1 TRINITY_DN1235_c0_g1~~TRINITY_DN1235_c0_g1_i4.p1  ORF type:complete len:1007 (-),score=213.79 TRINITY_DN1235_c0_g1_i4:333-3353(-)